MGRPERPVDPDAGPIQRFAHELRALRGQAGSPAYRAMAQRVGVSVTALSRAAAGENLPSLAVALAYVRACDGDEAAWEAHWKAASEDRAAPVAQDGESPYRGLARFEPGDRKLFFGRDRILGDLLEVVQENRFAALVGASGSGKSSLLRAGLVPRLQEYAQDLGHPAVVRILAPGQRPAAAFQHLLAPGEGEPDSWVVVDQFEEVFTLCRDRDERTRFIDLLLTAHDPATRLRAVIAMRGDFYARCAEHAPLAEALRHSTLLVGQMNAAELREAVTGPATAAGIVVERRLTARLVDEVVDEPGGLPMLSHALLETWRRRRGRILTLEAYEAAGGVHGAIAATAERVHEQLTPEQVRTARRLLLRLISPGEGTADTRRPAERTELDEWLDPELSTVIEELAAARLLSIDGETVELAHEALISSWPRLRGWIDEDREHLRQQRMLGEAAYAWRRLGYDPEALCRGTRLDQAAEAFAHPSRERELAASERAFLTASLDARARDLRSAARTRRRRRNTRVTLTALLAVLLTVSLAAWQLRRTDQRESNQVAARRVAAVADSLRTTDPRTAMLLSAAAWHVAQLTETRAALLGSLAQPERDVFTDPDQGAETGRSLVDSGRTLLSTAGRSWRTWSTLTHRQLSSGTLPAPAAVGVAADPDGRVLALETPEGWRLWDLTAHRWTGAAQPVPDTYLARFSSDPHSYLVVGINDDDAELRAVPDGKPLLKTAVGSESNVATSSDGRLVAVCPDSGALFVHDLATGRDLPGDWTGSDGDHCSDQSSLLRFDPAAHRLAAVSDSGIRVWDTTTGQLIADLDYPKANTVTFSANGAFLAAVGADEIAAWRLSAPGPPVFRTSLNGERMLGDVAWDPNRPVLRYLEGGTVHTLDLGEAVTADWLDTPAAATALSPDSRTLATAEKIGNHFTFRLIDTADGRPLRTLPSVPLPVPQDGAGPVAALSVDPLMAFSPDGASFAYGTSVPGRVTSDQRLVIWDLPHNRVRSTLNLAPSSGTDQVEAIVLGPDGRTLIASRAQSVGATGEVWDAPGHRLTAHLGPLANNTLAVGPGAGLLVGDNSVATLPAGPNRGRTLSLGEDVDAVAFNASGTLVAVGDASGRVALWNGTLTRQLGVLPDAFPPSTADSQPETVTAVAFSPDGSTLAVAGDAGSLRLWDAASHQPLGGGVTTPGEGITTLAFSPDSTTLYASSPHVPLQHYDLAPAHALAAICSRTGGGLTTAQWSTFIPEIPYLGVC
ncbi:MULTISPECIES: hypothetical protein [unclassified Streptomyces]|uniref:nSTAND1 domain-containing NTPase n=1 Tax=unclassified Streptomyces TaxID=2593676 RepID=UPI00190BB07C|nr:MULTISPECIES: hypothetical protein [unclassified Streptomyces]MBK3563250.1 hypothetical protein [Streptomyces sp. MBT62]MBK6018005.1 hypothetical protein [Streptomyces sp. MBT53]